MGLECLIAISESAPDRGIRYRHAWNLVRLKNTWYHLDAAFDNSLGRYGQKRFDYFNLDDKMIFKDHQLCIRCCVHRTGEGFIIKKTGCP